MKVKFIISAILVLLLSIGLTNTASARRYHRHSWYRYGWDTHTYRTDRRDRVTAHPADYYEGHTRRYYRRHWYAHHYGREYVGYHRHHRHPRHYYYK